MQRAIFISARFSSIATDAQSVIQIFNVGAERMLGYTAADVVDRLTPSDISDPDEIIARATAFSLIKSVLGRQGVADFWHKAGDANSQFHSHLYALLLTLPS